MAARADIAAIRGRGHRPVLVGGSGLYVRAALDRLEIPPTDPEVRARLEAEAEVGRAATPCTRGSRELRPGAARPIEPGNVRRVVRALEVIELTGRPFCATMPTREFVCSRGRCSACASTAERPRRAHRPHGSSGCGSRACATRRRRCSTPGLRDGVTASRALGYSQALAVIDGDARRRPRRGRRHRAGDPPLRPPAGVVVPPRPADRLARRASTPTCSTGRSTSVREADAGAATAWRRMADMTRFTKGHGTENDFVLVPDLEGSLELTPAQVQRLADRHAGLGGDGVIRVVRDRARHRRRRCGPRPRTPSGSWTTATPTARSPRCAATAPASSRRTCGARGSPSAATFAIATRAGVKTGPGRRRGVSPSTSARGGSSTRRVRDATASTSWCARGHGKPVPALSLDLGNPHAVVMLPEGITLENLDLTEAPELHPEPADGPNVEFVRAVGPGHIAMRVHERGVGETRSCGTGAAAAALATRFWSGVEDAQPVDRRRARWAPHRDAAARPAGRARRARRPRRRRHFRL